jgi:DNA-binding transcriptional LysR family regulator
MRQGSLDLNLLIALDALLDEASVTKAAERLQLGQPAMSASLGRLRRYYNDDILARVGNRYELTPLAVQLRRRTAVALASVERVFEKAPVFDPARAEREFKVLCSDYAIATIGAAVTRLVSAEAPHVRMNLAVLPPDLLAREDEFLRSVDAVVLPHGYLPDALFIDMFEDAWVVLVATQNAHVGEALTMEHLSALPWVLTYNRTLSTVEGARQLTMHGIEPRTEVMVDSFLAVAPLIAGTDRVALIPSRIAPRLAAMGDVRTMPCPFDAVPLREALWWHPIHDPDAGHAWLRGVFQEAAVALQADRPVSGEVPSATA